MTAIAYRAHRLEFTHQDPTMSEAATTRRKLHTPTWTALLPAFFAVLESGTDEGKQIAREELARMAQAADLWNELPEADQ